MVSIKHSELAQWIVCEESNYYTSIVKIYKHSDNSIDVYKSNQYFEGTVNIMKVEWTLCEHGVVYI